MKKILVLLGLLIAMPANAEYVLVNNDLMIDTSHIKSIRAMDCGVNDWRVVFNVDNAILPIKSSHMNKEEAYKEMQRILKLMNKGR